MSEPFVLVVDDNPEALTFVATALEADGLRVRKAVSVLRAIEALHDGSPRPGLIITDLLMPQTTGWDFLKHLRGEAALASVPIVVITGADAGESEALADVVLRKPVDPDHLVETVRTLMTGRPAAG